MSTTKAKSTQKSSKDLKTTKMPLQTITKYFYKSPGPNQSAPVKIFDGPGPDDTKRTHTLKETPTSPTDLKPNSSGVCEVTARATIDLPNAIGAFSHLLHDPLNDVRKRPNNERSIYPSVKKAKLRKEKINLQEGANTSKKQSQKIFDLSFDTSEDEAEKDKGYRQTKHCKLCDYSHKNFKCMCNHYKYRHPYIKCNNAYIQDSGDQSYTFCCLECPAEFASLANVLKHYKSNHPEDLDVFTLHSIQHDVAFGCLLCPVTTSRMRAMVKHYKNKHPKRKVDISLMHWRHFVRTWQEEQSQLDTHGKVPDPEMSRGTSHESGPSPCEEGKSVSLPDVTFYNCSKCSFSHKSVIVLFVHYQKLHPNEVVTIDKLKRSNQGSSEMSLNTVMVREKGPDLKDKPNSSIETRSNAELLQQKKNPSHKPEASKTYLETKETTQTPTYAADGRKGEQPMAKHDENMSAGKHSLSSTNKMFYCYFCPFSNSNIRSIISHHNAMHAEEEPVNYENIILYSEQMQKCKHEGGAERSAGTVIDSTEREEFPHEKKAADTAKWNTNACMEKFYCQICNYAHETVTGISKHISAVHEGIHTDQESIVKYTALVRKDINESKSQVGELPFTTNLPLPLLSKGDEDKFFCYLCNYRHRDLKVVYKHCNGKHHALKASSKIYLYTAMVRKRALHQRTTTSQEKQLASIHDSDEHSEVDHQHRNEDQSPVLCSPEQTAASGTSDNISPDGHGEVQSLFKCPHCPHSFRTLSGYRVHRGRKHPGAEDKHLDIGQNKQMKVPIRVFTCAHCPYVTTKEHGLITHCGMMHPDRMPDVVCDLQELPEHLKGPGHDASLSGFQCKTCLWIFSSIKRMTQHCKDSHEDEETLTKAGRVMTKALAVSKRTNYMTKHKPEKLSKAFTSRRGINVTPKCQLCSYKCATKSGLLKHMRSCHKNETIPICLHKCLLCTNVFPKRSLLGSHYVLKHGYKAYLKYGVPLNKETRKQPASTSSVKRKASKPNTAEGNKVLVYKCPYCLYVNASLQGVLTHSQMAHQYLRIRGDELATEEVLMNNVVECTNEGTSSLRGYLCQRCQQVHSSLNRLKIHYEWDHRAVLEVSTTETVRHDQRIPTNSSQASTLSALGEELLFKCTICDYTGYSRKCLANHYYYKHKLDLLTRKTLLQKYDSKKKKAKNTPEAGTERHKPVSCRICPRLQFDTPKLLLAHYIACHGKLDFTVLSPARDRSTGIFRCCHCQKRLYGVRNLRLHLDRHRAWRQRAEKMKVSPARTSPMSPEIYLQQDLPTFATAGELAQWSVARAATSTLARPMPTDRPGDPRQPGRDSEDGHCCKLCGQLCASLKLLRLHEHAHASLSAFRKCLTASALKHIDRYISFRGGTSRSYTCSLCSFRTTVQDLCRSHFIKTHPDVPENDHKDEGRALTADSEPPHSSKKISTLPELNEEPGAIEESNPEFPNVQLQLVQYCSLASAGDQANTNTDNFKFTDTRALHCEICDFSSDHISSVRRHYMNRHGQKILKCKDCKFFTGLRKTMEMHQKMGHYTFQSEPTHQKVLPCPFCLYQSKNKNNMIDHIVLHREKRVVPIEVCRPKLSRYLQGVVFRCHKCTFTSGSAENLRLHMTQHDDVRPYKCRLCYFDCARLSDLEAHLSNKHQVLRNHELVGLINLDELEARAKKEEEHLTHQNNCNDATLEEFVADDETLNKNRSKMNTGENMAQQTEDGNQRQGQACKDKNGESSASVSLCENTTAKTAVRAQAEAVQSGDTTNRPGTENMAKQDFDDSNSVDNQDEDSNSLEREKRTNESQTLLSSETITQPKQKAADMISSPFIQLERLFFKMGRGNVEAQVEDDMLCDIALLDEDAHSCKKESHVTSPDKRLTHNGKGGQPEINHEKILDDFDCEGRKGANKKDREEFRDAEGEKAEPESETVKEESDPLGCDHMKQELEGEHERISDEDWCMKEEHQESNGEEQGISPRMPEVIDEDAAVVEDLLTCQLCGRRFTDSTDLEHHIMRHRI